MSRECVVQALCGSESWSADVACNSRPVPLAMADSQVLGHTKVNIQALFEKERKKEQAPNL
jgi:hypothetical protein